MISPILMYDNHYQEGPNLENNPLFPQYCWCPLCVVNQNNKKFYLEPYSASNLADWSTHCTDLLIALLLEKYCFVNSDVGKVK